jgi:tetratricopeptide (TPR) repeat protein
MGHYGLYREILAHTREHFGDGHPFVCATASNLAECLDARGDPDAALASFGLAHSTARAIWTADHEYALDAACRRAALLRRLERNDEAEGVLREAYEGLTDAFDPDAATRLVGQLVDALVERGAADDARALLARHAARSAVGSPARAWCLERRGELDAGL